MANGIGRVWAANAGDDEQKPNGVGSVWIENIDALTPSGGASEQQINELSAAIDYVSANAGDPNALTGYQEDGVGISAAETYFEAKGFNYDFHVGETGHLSAKNSASAVFTNGSLVSADSNGGFLVSAGGGDFKIYQGLPSFSSSRIYTNLDDYGLNVSGTPNKGNLSAGFGNSYGDNLYANLGGTNFKVNYIGVHYSRPQQGVSANVGGWQGNGIGLSGMGTLFEVCNGSTASISNGARLYVQMGGAISADNGANLHITQGASAVLDGQKQTFKIGGYGLEASGSRFISADSEDVSAWSVAPMVALGQYNQTSSNAAFVIGNGTNGTTGRSDLFVIDYSGNAQSNDFIAGNGNKLSDSIQTSELEFDADNAITAIAGSAIGGQGGGGNPEVEALVTETSANWNSAYNGLANSTTIVGVNGKYQTTNAAFENYTTLTLISADCYTTYSPNSWDGNATVYVDEPVYSGVKSFVYNFKFTGYSAIPEYIHDGTKLINSGENFATYMNYGGASYPGDDNPDLGNTWIISIPKDTFAPTSTDVSAYVYFNNGHKRTIMTENYIGYDDNYIKTYGSAEFVAGNYTDYGEKKLIELNGVTNFITDNVDDVTFNAVTTGEQNFTRYDGNAIIQFEGLSSYSDNMFVSAYCPSGNNNNNISVGLYSGYYPTNASRVWSGKVNFSDDIASFNLTGVNAGELYVLQISSVGRSNRDAKLYTSSYSAEQKTVRGVEIPSKSDFDNLYNAFTAYTASHP